MNIIAGMKYNLTVKFCTLVLKLWLHYCNLCMPNFRFTICILYQYFFVYSNFEVWYNNDCKLLWSMVIMELSEFIIIKH